VRFDLGSFWLSCDSHRQRLSTSFADGLPRSGCGPSFQHRKPSVIDSINQLACKFRGMPLPGVSARPLQGLFALCSDGKSEEFKSTIVLRSPSQSGSLANGIGHNRRA